VTNKCHLQISEKKKEILYKKARAQWEEKYESSDMFKFNLLNPATAIYYIFSGKNVEGREWMIARGVRT